MCIKETEFPDKAPNTFLHLTTDPLHTSDNGHHRCKRRKEEDAIWYVQLCKLEYPEYETYLCGCSVRLGNSGLKVSRIILGTMQYGSSKWQDWVLDEPEAIGHIKFA